MAGKMKSILINISAAALLIIAFIVIIGVVGSSKTPPTTSAQRQLQPRLYTRISCAPSAPVNFESGGVLIDFIDGSTMIKRSAGGATLFSGTFSPMNDLATVQMHTVLGSTALNTGTQLDGIPVPHPEVDIVTLTGVKGNTLFIEMKSPTGTFQLACIPADDAQIVVKR